jgi:hypothetical protein
MPAEHPSQYRQGELAQPGLMLDLSASPWNLGPGESRMILGRDVVHPGRIAPDGGRKPVGCSIPLADRPLTSVIECAFEGRVAMRWQCVYSAYHAVTNPTGQELTFTVGGPSLAITRHDGRGWESGVVGGMFGASPVYVDPGTVDQGRFLWELRQVTSVNSLGGIDNDTVWAEPGFSFTPRDQITKLWIDYAITVDRNGILVSNGRKFWLLQGGTYYQVMDLGSDDYLGERWSGSMIANDRILLTNAKRPPRLFFFRDSLPNAEVSPTGNYAGLGTPVKPPHKEPDYTDVPIAGNVPSWLASVGGEGTGSLSAGVYRAMVRMVNLNDGGQSRFVRVFSNADRTTDALTVLATGSFRVFSWVTAATAGQPPFDPRWTHLELWRTEADGAEYFLVGRVPIVSFANEYLADSAVAGNSGTNSLISVDTARYQAGSIISDANLNRRTVLTVSEILAGYRPPVCREAVSVQGVTICAGKADAAADPHVSQYAYGYFCHDTTGAGTIYTHATRKLQFAAAGALFSGYTDYTDGDEFVITDCSNAAKIGTYALEAKSSDSELLFADPGPGEDLTDIRGYIRRAYRTASPTLDSDEEVGYSRTDQYAPESFLARKLTLSRNGDRFAGMRAVGRYAAVIMADGVHLLYLTTDATGAIVLEKHTVASNGAGTSWSDSICTWERNVAWANKRGAWVLVTSDDADDTGARGKIVSLDKGAMRDWFDEAHRLGQSIDAGVDTHNECVRFRRHIDAHTVQVWQVNYRTGQATLLDDDAGLAYVRSKYADSSEVVDPLLYSVGSDGSVFEVNHYGLTHPYDGKTVQAIASVANGYTVTTTSITKAGVFSAAMLGDVVRFRSSTAGVNGTARTITAADADSITFAAVTGLAEGDEFIIGATRFRLRSSPLRGSNPHAVKTLNGLIVRVRPGPRNTDGNWTVPTDPVLTVRSYRDHYDGAVDDEQVREIPVYEESDLTRTDGDKVSALTGQGTALEIELECLESRTDFLVESIFPDVREDGGQQADATATA